MDGSDPVGAGSGSLRRVNPLLAEVLARHGGVASRRCVTAAGVSAATVEWALRRGVVVAPVRGVLADGDLWRGTGPDARHLLVLRVLATEGSGVVAAGLSAAMVWELPTASGPPERPVLLTARSTRRPEYGSTSGTSVRRRSWLADDEVTVVSGIPVTGLVRTAVDVARSVPLPWGLAAADVVCTRGVAAHELADAVRAMAPVPGSRRAGVAAAWADGRAESPLESVARAIVRMLGLPCPNLQVWLHGDGRRYRVDMIVPEFRTVIEVDGKIKYEGASASPDQSWQDKRRRDDFISWGYRSNDSSRPTPTGHNAGAESC